MAQRGKLGCSLLEERDGEKDLEKKNWSEYSRVDRGCVGNDGWVLLFLTLALGRRGGTRLRGSGGADGGGI